MPVIEVAFSPVIARLGPLELGWHGVFSVLAVIVAMWLGLRRARRRGLPAEPMGAVVTWAFVGGVVGARLFHVLDNLPSYLANPLAIVAIWQGGIAVYGAFLGGIAGGLLAARRARIPAWPLLDAAAPAMLVGQAIGRLGCLSNGDAWGAPTGGPWGIVYSRPDALLPPELLGVPTHPYPLYEIAAVVLLLAGLWLARRPLTAPGQLFLVAAIGYAAIRFSLSFFRQETVVAWGLQEAQLVALATGFAALGVLLVRWGRGPAVRSAIPIALVVALVFVSCGPPGARLAGTDLGAGPAPDFTLVDGRTGAPVSLSDLRGKVVALTFLYTSCPDVCPLTAAAFRRAQRDLGPDGGDVVFVAVSADPQRDTPAAVQAFSRAHDLDSGWHYLIGPRAQLERVWSAYGVFVTPDEGRPTVTHTDAVFLIDREGRERVLLRTDRLAEDLVADLRQLITEP